MRIKVGGTAMLDFIIKYWVEFGFGLIVAGGGYLIKRYLKMREIEQSTERAKFYDKLKKDVFSKYDEITHAAMFSYDVELTIEQEELLADLVATYGQEIISKTNEIFQKIKLKREAH